jgi:hypothetical protein
MTECDICKQSFEEVDLILYQREYEKTNKTLFICKKCINDIKVDIDSILDDI